MMSTCSFSQPRQQVHLSRTVHERQESTALWHLRRSPHPADLQRPLEASMDLPDLHDDKIVNIFKMLHFNYIKSSYPMNKHQKFYMFDMKYSQQI